MSELRRPGRPAVIAFLRHAGCPFAEATVRALRASAEAHPEIDFVAVSHAGEVATRDWAARFGGWPENVRLTIDLQRALYARYGALNTSLWHWLSPRATWRLLPLALRGIRNRRSTGTRAQSAATVALDAGGQVRYRHLPEHAGDLPDLRRAVEALSTD